MAIILAPGIVLVAGRKRRQNFTVGAYAFTIPKRHFVKNGSRNGESTDGPEVRCFHHDDDAIVQLDLIGPFHGYHCREWRNGAKDAGYIAENYLGLISVPGEDKDSGFLTGV